MAKEEMLSADVHSDIDILERILEKMISLQRGLNWTNSLAIMITYLCLL